MAERAASNANQVSKKVGKLPRDATIRVVDTDEFTHTMMLQPRCYAEAGSDVFAFLRSAAFPSITTMIPTSTITIANAIIITANP